MGHLSVTLLNHVVKAFGRIIIDAWAAAWGLRRCTTWRLAWAAARGTNWGLFGAAEKPTHPTKRNHDTIYLENIFRSLNGIPLNRVVAADV